MKKVIIITGGIGSGKSEASRMLRERGVAVYGCDSRAKALYGRYPHLRELLVEDIFNRPQELEALEAALFPLLMEDFLAWADEQKGEFVAMESATVLQKKFFDNFGDCVLLVDAPPQLRLQRAVQRGGCREDIQRRMELQADLRDNPRVSFVADNLSSMQHLEEQIDEFLKSINYYGKREN